VIRRKKKNMKFLRSIREQGYKVLFFVETKRPQGRDLLDLGESRGPDAAMATSKRAINSGGF